MARQRPALRLGVFVFSLSICCPPAQSAVASERTPGIADGIVTEVIDLTNTERVHHRRAELRPNARLMRAAQLQADQMARASRMAHVLPDARYPNLQDRIAAAKYQWRTIGENVAFGQPSAAKVLDSWMHSPGHRTNILNSNFTEMGAGYAVDRTGRPYYVQVFARPVS